MLPKLLIRRLTSPFFRGSGGVSSNKPKSASAPVQEEDEAAGSSALKIIHVGGLVEFYYMAVPAVKIMDKYPSFLLARPEIFRRPWDSLVHPEEILMPGQRFFVVPRRTVKKLQRRIRQPISSNFSTESSSSWQSLSYEFSSKSVAASRDKNVIKCDPLPSTSGSSFASLISTPNSMLRKPRIDQVSALGIPSRRSKRSAKSHKVVMWNPTLTVVHEESPACGT
ncbi:hypothetical protein AQUCO_01400290v1 [Aquilegia coerulea]|uniref:Uncharacterized protein n=1 Tax=Aquilegia coerulea TaxID=218851 RepID=A0A2G5DVJ7_AQUCA|nr:hypothetical protein AQUCO_01400290v1 [Aquilegia coerulea]